MSLWDFLDSNFLSTAVLLGTGVLAFSTYFIQKRNEVTDAATILLSEIRSAEKAISTIRTHNQVTELSVILPANSWNKFSHLFARRLDQDELSQVSEFYKKCELAENYRKFWFEMENEGIKSKARYVQTSLIDLAVEAINTDEAQDYQRKRALLINITNDENHVFCPGGPLGKLFSHIANIEFVTTSTTGKKLKSLGNSK